MHCTEYADPATGFTRYATREKTTIYGSPPLALTNSRGGRDFFYNRRPIDTSSRYWRPKGRERVLQLAGLDKKLIKSIPLGEFESWCEAAWERLTHNGLPAHRVPFGFAEQARTVSFHRDGERWDLLYRLLSRLTQEDPGLLRQPSEPDVTRFFAMEREVRHSAGEMKATLKFEKVRGDGGETYRAWHRPKHPILKYVAPFFARRLHGLSWTIHTPDESAHWDGRRLHFDDGKRIRPKQARHNVETLRRRVEKLWWRDLMA